MKKEQFSPYRVADYLTTPSEITAYLKAARGRFRIRNLKYGKRLARWSRSQTIVFERLQWESDPRQCWYGMLLSRKPLSYCTAETAEFRESRKCGFQRCGACAKPCRCWGSHSLTYFKFRILKRPHIVPSIAAAPLGQTRIVCRAINQKQILIVRYLILMIKGEGTEKRPLLGSGQEEQGRYHG